MIDTDTIDRLSRKYSMSQEEFVKLGSTLAMKEKKRSLQIEKLEILARYAQP
jgi:plasmid maintenance system antidote protein VapI